MDRCDHGIIFGVMIPVVTQTPANIRYLRPRNRRTFAKFDPSQVLQCLWKVCNNLHRRNLSVNFLIVLNKYYVIQKTPFYDAFC